MSETTEFRPGLEGVVAVETEIAEPDREGGALRYRGVDIEELVGRVPYEKRLGAARRRRASSSGMPEPEPYEPRGSPATRRPTCRPRPRVCRAYWGLGKLNEISDEQAREDLGRLSAQMMAIVARSARVADGASEPVPDDVVARGTHRRREVPAPLARRGGPART